LLNRCRIVQRALQTVCPAVSALVSLTQGGEDLKTGNKSHLNNVRLKPDQESVWAYPRPPRLEAISKHIRVCYAGRTIAETRRAYRVLETSHPPVYYIPPEDICVAYLQPESGSSLCEWKGQARYFSVVVDGKRAQRAAWSYPNPSRAFAAIGNYVAFYAGLMDACTVDGEKVQPQEGNFYGGWITKDVVGPFKGAAGSSNL